LGFIDVYPMRFSFVADHFAYLATIGLIALFAAAAYTLVSRLRIPKPWPIVGVTVVLLALMRISAVRCLDYMDRETLWIVTIAQNPNCWMANNNLGTIRFKQQRYNEASRLLQNALGDRVNDEPSREEKGDMHYYLGASLISLGKPDEGTAHFQQAAALYRLVAESETPPTAETNNNLGILYGQLQQYEESIRYFERAVEIDPSKPNANLNLGELYFRLKRFDDSAACFREVLEIEPNSARAHYSLGTIALTEGQRKEAIEHLQKTLRIEPDHVEARTVLQQILADPGSK
jgi:tetratricopeptide (TPR) repeat protein